MHLSFIYCLLFSAFIIHITTESLVFRWKTGENQFMYSSGPSAPYWPQASTAAPPDTEGSFTLPLNSHCFTLLWVSETMSILLSACHCFVFYARNMKHVETCFPPSVKPQVCWEWTTNRHDVVNWFQLAVTDKTWCSFTSQYCGIDT